jgi:Zn finger protein HypA/HybF involved in hydrogenase expression
MADGMQFYRCETCHGVVSPWDIDNGECPKCGAHRIRPTDLTLLEKVVQIIKHPKVWTWGKRTDYRGPN